MGIYLNPGNQGFSRIKNSEYVDKTGLLHLINQTIDTTMSLSCVSRPRRFGKSFAAQMLCAYYDYTSDSHSLFDDLDIAQYPDYQDHINRYHVIYLDITGFISRAKRKGSDIGDVPNEIVESVKKELTTIHNDLAKDEPLSNLLIECVKQTDRKFIFIIDEWDALIREAQNDPVTQSKYLNLLREWFKNGNFTPYVVAAAYITGILPIKKDGSQSAISDFREYTILQPAGFAQYTGFTESDVRKLCNQYGMDFEQCKAWYDGYHFEATGSIYNPYSVMSAMQNGKYRSYWQKTSAAESLMTYIDMDFEGLQEDILRLISGERLEVSIDDFENDFESFKSKDDVLTLFIHLGYLAYDEDNGTARIPNEEVRMEFHKILAKPKSKRLAALIRTSQELLQYTINGNADKVVQAIELIRDSEYAPNYYNNEQALRYVIKFAYITCVDQYLRIEEIPAGHGIAEVVFLPKKHSPLPAMVVELKWDKTANGALSQIKDRNYPAVLNDFGGDVILVGINYDSRTKKHTCEIEQKQMC